MNTYTGTSSIS